MITITGNNAIEKASKLKGLQLINDNCNAQQIEVLQRMASNPNLNKLLNQKTIDKLEKNLPMLLNFI